MKRLSIILGIVLICLFSNFEVYAVTLTVEQIEAIMNDDSLTDREKLAVLSDGNETLEEYTQTILEHVDHVTGMVEGLENGTYTWKEREGAIEINTIEDYFAHRERQLEALDEAAQMIENYSNSLPYYVTGISLIALLVGLVKLGALGLF